VLNQTEQKPANIEQTLKELTGINVANMEKHEKLFVYHLFLESREEIRKAKDDSKSQKFADYFNNKIDTFIGYLDDSQLEKLKIDQEKLKENIAEINKGLNSSQESVYKGKDHWFRFYGYDDNFTFKLWEIDKSLELDMKFALNIPGENERLHYRTDPLGEINPLAHIVIGIPSLIITGLRLGINTSKQITNNAVKVLDCSRVNNQTVGRQ